jgi:hypothetical protein
MTQANAGEGWGGTDDEITGLDEVITEVRIDCGSKIVTKTWACIRVKDMHAVVKISVSSSNPRMKLVKSEKQPFWPRHLT